MKTINLFYYYGKVFILTNIWMNGKNSMKRHYLKKKKDFYSHLNMEDITEADYTKAKKFVKIFK